MYKKFKNAYMTLEASLVMPIILGSIIFTIYLGFYLYNVCTIEQAAYIAALRGSQVTKGSLGEIKNYVEKEMEKLLGNRVLLKEQLEQKIDVSSHKVKVRIMLNMHMPFFHWVSSKVDFWTIEVKEEANRIYPVDIIRNVRKINESQISK